MTQDMNEFEKLIGFQKFDNRLIDNRKILLWGVIDDDMAKDVITRMLYLDQENAGKKISLYINSPGGVVSSGLAIYDAINLLSSPVATICMGQAASMASILLSAGEKGSRIIWPNARVMIHQPSISNLEGQAIDLEIYAKEIGKTKSLSAKILAEHCGHSVEGILKDFDRDYWMNAEESVTYGIVDGMADKID
jgi:ATP-dependent Clp protease protease subunit